ncbi:MAG: TonB-dependent receptor plug domain-containing protein, partial [Caulobacterales bacterium]|nr:TonB-dependent receptor plug domain-containing protein [Caulobacterales bacterium]
MAASSATALMAAGLGHVAGAQEADAETEGGGERALEQIVVTGTATGRSQIESAVAVTNVSYETIAQFQPTSEAELFRLLPGIQVSGTVGPGGNSNIAVRGLPVATGGAPFVQIQEDGLPTVLFGDIQFGNNDYWTNFDSTVSSVEALRGGSSGTFASQAPGAVINYISRTGEEEGGFAKLTSGLGFDEQQIDFRIGGPVSDTVRYHVGGYFRTGEGPLDSGFRVTDSIQIKGNITKEFSDGSGFFRANLKFADTQEPNYTGAPFFFDDDGSSVSDFDNSFPGFDGLDDSAYSALNQNMLVYEADGFRRVDLDGITTEQFAIGFEFDRDLGDFFTVNNKFRWSDISGAFANPFFGVARTDSVIGSQLSINGDPYATVAEIRYANGPRAGEVFTDTYLDNNAIFRTDVPDLGSYVNDLRVSGEFDTGLGYLTALAGFFYMDQTIAANWKVNRGVREVSGSTAAALDL